MLSGFTPVHQHYLLQARQMQALSFAVHIPLVCFGISYPIMVLFVEWLYLRTGDGVYLQLARRWTRILVDRLPPRIRLDHVDAGGAAVHRRHRDWIFVGVLTVASSAYLAAVYLAADATHTGEARLEQAFRRRALGPVIVSFIAGLATLALVYRRAFTTARYTAATAVAAMVAGLALARWPTIIPRLTVYGAAAGHA